MRLSLRIRRAKKEFLRQAVVLNSINIVLIIGIKHPRKSIIFQVFYAVSEDKDIRLRNKKRLYQIFHNPRAYLSRLLNHLHLYSYTTTYTSVLSARIVRIILAAFIWDKGLAQNIAEDKTVFGHTVSYTISKSSTQRSTVNVAILCHSVITLIT